MKKSKLLTIATGFALVATSFGTFAVWDKFNSEASTVVSIADGKTVTVQDGTFGSMAETIGTDKITYTGDASFTVDGAANVKSLAPTITLWDGTTQLTDTSVIEATIENPTQAVADTVVYNTKVTVKDNSLAKKDITVKVSVVATPNS